MSNDQNPTLESLFKDLLEKVTSLKINYDNFIFSSKNLPIPPPVLETDELTIAKGPHYYDRESYRADVLLFEAEKEIYGYLGLLTLAVLFHEEVDRVELRLTDPDSQIKNLRIDFKYYDYEEVTGYQSRPFALNYYPEKIIGQHPWYYSRVDPWDLPCFVLTNSEESIDTDEDWRNRDTVVGFGNDKGSCRFAELLLNLAQVENETVMIALEGEGGFRGVGINSAEVKIDSTKFWENVAKGKEKNY